MERLIVYCEGSTEESFVTAVLAPYFWKKKISVTPISMDGVSKYSIIKKELVQLCKGDPTATITTMFDYYGLPNDTPGVSTASGTIYNKAQHIEASVETDLGGLKNLIFNLSVHEYEGLLFSRTSAFKDIANDRQLAALKSISENFETPEHINDSYDTTPSRRIENIISGYSKVNDGTNVAKLIGIDGISEKCHHFGKWIAKIVALTKDGVSA